MTFEQQVQLSLTVLLTGLAIVFLMLIALTFIIKGYGSALNRMQGKREDRPVAPAPGINQNTIQQGIPAEVVAAIAAAVYTMYGSSADQIKSIRRAAPRSRSAWRTAGLLEATKPFE